MKIHDVAIVGLGNMGMRHVAIVGGSHRARLTAVLDVDPERAREVGSRTGSPAYTDLERMLAEVPVDAVIICTPDALHVEPSVACARAGKHILLEKPIATSLEDADTILEAAAESGVRFTVGHCLRFDEKYVATQRQIEAGAVGEIASISTMRQNSLSAQERLLGRVSSPMFLGVHDYDIVNWYLRSEPVEVYCATVERVLASRGYPTDDVAWTTIRYQSGAVAMAETGWILPSGYPLRYRFALTAYGDEGTAHLSVFDDGVSIVNDRWQYLPMGDRLTPQLHHFLDCIETGSEPLVSGRAARSALEIALAAERSASEGLPIRLSQTPDVAPPNTAATRGGRESTGRNSV